MILAVHDLTVQFPSRIGWLTAVDHVSFSLERGDIFGIVGESGSGKSVTARALLGMVREPGRITAGEVRILGSDILRQSAAELRALRGSRIALVTQDPLNSLNPVLTIREQLVEAVAAHYRTSRRAQEHRAEELLALVGIPDASSRLDNYPHQFSGGMRQRVLIAMALMNEPEIVVADEPTTALDATVQAQVLQLLVDLNEKLGTTIVLITHNMGVVARTCRRVMVMYGGRVAEIGPVDDIFRAPRHPYTVGLLGSIPRLDAPRHVDLPSIPGQPPTLLMTRAGCIFTPRCPLAIDRCHLEAPDLATVGPEHAAACWRSQDVRTVTSQRVAAAIEPADVTEQAGHPLLVVDSLTQEFVVSHRRRVRAVADLSLSLGAGRTIGLVGESGSGKSTIARTIVGIYPPTSGRISIHGQQIAGDGSRAFSRSIRRKLQMIFQDPSASLDPRMTVRGLIAEPIGVHRLLPKPLMDDRVVELLNLVGLHKSLAGRYPHELSGGQRQRVAIARALAVEPSVLVCDEPVSALDVSLQAQVINLFSDLQARLGISYLFIAHDLAVVRHLSDEIIVLYLGRVMEKGPAAVVCDQPLHPYTHSLISAVPVPDPAIEQRRKRIVLRGDPPSPINRPSGCPFHTRCPVGPAVYPERQICRLETPLLSEVTPGQMVACHFPDDMPRLIRAMTPTTC